MSPTRQLDIAGILLEKVRAIASHAHVAVLVTTTSRALTRFANSTIHQNLSDESVVIRLTVHADGRTIASTTGLTAADGLDKFIADTITMVRVSPLDPSWPGLAPIAQAAGQGTVDPAILCASPIDRARLVRAFVDAAGGLTTAGYCQTRHVAATFVNSAGQSVAGASTDVSFDGIARTPTSDGVARLASARLADIDGALLGTQAAAKAIASAHPTDLAPGRYEVVLEPGAARDVVQALATHGFNGKAFVDGASFLIIGEQQFDEKITIVDDSVSPGMIGLPFDMEGTPKRRVELVTAGTSKSPTHNRRTAAVVGAQSTGHNVGTSLGALAMNMSVMPHSRTVATVLGASTSLSGAEGAPVAPFGPAVDASAASIVARVSHGLLVTDHWYTRALDPSALVMTGLTRNGVWLIEKGEVTRPLRNLRFTQSYLQALGPGGVFGVGAHAPAQPSNYGLASFRVPTLHLASWNFTGGTSG